MKWPIVISTFIAGCILGIIPVLPAVAQTLPSSQVYGWGAKEAWISCGKTNPACNQSPVAVNGLSNVIKLDASDVSNLAIESNGTVWAWGQNSYGELGNGTTTASATPVQVSGLSNVVATDTGNSDAVALESNGTVWSWGNNANGQLCNGSKGGYETIPQPISALNSLPGGVKVTSVAAGGNKTVFLLSNGTVMTCGLNGDGELGNGSTKPYTDLPVEVSNVSGQSGHLQNVVAISSGNLFIGALLSNGTVVSWGNNAYGQLGNGTTTNSSVPVPVSGLSGVAQISYGGDEPNNGHSMALLSNGTVMTWGDNASGQLGNGTTTNSSVPVAVTGLSDGVSSDVTTIAAGGLHSMALLSDGSLMMWGDNSEGQLGNGTTMNSTVPIKVLSNCEFISAGALDSLAALTPAS